MTPATRELVEAAKEVLHRCRGLGNNEIDLRTAISAVEAEAATGESEIFRERDRAIQFGNTQIKFRQEAESKLTAIRALKEKYGTTAHPYVTELLSQIGSILGEK